MGRCFLFMIANGNYKKSFYIEMLICVDQHIDNRYTTYKLKCYISNKGGNVV